MNTPTMHPLPLGLDWGRGNFKISGSHGTAWLPSHVAHANGSGTRKADAGIRVAQPQYDIQFDAGTGTPAHYHVGHNAPLTGTAIEALDLTDYTGALDQRALLYAALTEYSRKYGLAATPDAPIVAKVSVGVPQKALVGEEAPGRKSAIRQWLTTTHTWTAKGTGQMQTYRLMIDKVGVASQAVGALFYYMTHPDRSYRTDVMDAILSKPLGILSLGSSTLELTAVQLRDNGRTRLPEILPDLEGSYALGAYHMLNMSGEMQDWSLGYRDQQFRNAPKSHETAMSNWLRQVQGHINQRWGSHHKDFAAVFVVGGMLKVPHVRDWTRKQFRNAVLAGFDLGDQEDDCITAISQGLYRQIH
jgi:hypothetical protein